MPMILAISGQDLRRFELALLVLTEGVPGPGCEIRASLVTDDAPEKYLARVDAFFTEHGVTLKELSGILVVTGPGSFTASRLSVTLANTLGFTQNLPLFPLENPAHVPLLDLLAGLDLAHLPSVLHASPHYDRPPFITAKPIPVDGSLGANV